MTEEDKLLPTPNAGATNYDETPETWRARQAKVYAETGKGNGPGNTGPLGIAVAELRPPSSPSSPGSEDSTSPSSTSDTDASDRSSGTSTPPLFSNDTGPESPDGETSTSSALLPTPNAGLTNYDESPETFDARRARIKEQGINGNGMGDSLGVAVQRVSISSAEASPASPSAPPGDARRDRMSAGSGPSSPVLLTSYDPEASSSRTSEVSYRLVMWTQPQASLFEDRPSARSSVTWPTSGSMRDGVVYAHPMSERPTDASESSSLPTPAARDGKGRDITREGGPSLPQQMSELLPTPVADHSRGLAQTGTIYQSLPNAVLDLLPTPRANDGTGPGEHGTGGQDLRTEVRAMLPTPEASDATGGRRSKELGGKRPSGAKRAITLGTAVDHQQRSPGEPTEPPSPGGSE